MKQLGTAFLAVLIGGSPALAYENCAGSGAQRRCYNSSSNSTYYPSERRALQRSDPNLSGGTSRSRSSFGNNLNDIGSAIRGGGGSVTVR